MIYGYARVSTENQSLEQQEAELRAMGAEVLLSERRSGAKKRPELEKLLEELQEGDALYVVRLDRLARSILDLDRIATITRDKGVTLRMGGMTYNPSDPTSRLLFNQLALIAEFERDLIIARTNERLEYMRAEGMQVGRKRLTDAKQDAAIFRLYSDGYSYSELQKATGLSRSVVHRIVREGTAADKEAQDPTIRRARRTIEATQQRVRSKPLQELRKMFAPSEEAA
ncbi:recombinase family protein [Microbacterium sp. Leaf151]|uniref:recombinase family protein n=1 Tax=Microbacterium sp. Leaf151 TaxID=1736276 RepID=UPI0006F8B7E4|nr:recombinase family protein [Microbacterium sp. Leaf151]KQR25782.1 hypothetical protein ASF76_00295 [Microbacterium sp. Leaf151]